MIFEQTSFLSFKRIEIKYSEFIAQLVQQFISEHQVEQIDFVALHGHTIFHNPADKITVQALNLNTVAASLGLDVIGNFR